MSETRPRFWKRKGTWDVADWVALACAALAGAWAALAEPHRKLVPALIAAGCTIVAGLAKLRSKQCDELEKQARAAELADIRTRAANHTRRTVGAILAHMHDQLFEREADHEKYKHRVTLFEFDPARSCLVVYAREGVFADSTRTWPVDPNDPAGCKGVVGKVWFFSSIDVRAAECDWPEDGNATDKERYAKSFELSVAEAEALNVKSRVFAGVIVLVGGKRWGVLVTDSRKDWLSTNRSARGRQTKLLERYSALIGRVIEEAQC